jgi:hypothetical protein
LCVLGKASTPAQIPLRDMHYAMRHGDARTTNPVRHGPRQPFDRHASRSVAACLAGMAIG